MLGIFSKAHIVNINMSSTVSHITVQYNTVEVTVCALLAAEHKAIRGPELGFLNNTSVSEH